ncbi:MAG: SDR family NAD(P)-dependent oxidoreductase, partial [Chitinophagaceae bacterium]|nr:SDR family NAD(P)-dependent oxidoreductase [Chitinophagaceae bacterium]
MNNEITGKVIAITGASSRIGEAAAITLAKEGARLVLGARRSDRLEALANRIQQEGGKAVFSVTDVTRRSDM